MELKKDRAAWLAKRLLGTSLEEALRIPTVESSIEAIRDFVSHKIPPRTLGLSTSGDLSILNDSDRQDHFHVIGYPNQGKSKFLERMMCEDIIQLQDNPADFQSGFCFLDASPNAGTMRKVLRFCKSRNFTKLLI